MSIHIFLPVVFVFRSVVFILEPEIDLLHQHMAISDMRKVACVRALHTGVFNRKFGNFLPKQRVNSWEMDVQIFGPTLGTDDKAKLNWQSQWNVVNSGILLIIPESVLNCPKCSPGKYPSRILDPYILMFSLAWYRLTIHSISHKNTFQWNIKPFLYRW